MKYYRNAIPVYFRIKRKKGGEMKRKKMLILLILFSFITEIYGCCGNAYRKVDKVEVEQTAPPPLIIWNESKYDIMFFLVRKDGGEVRNFPIKSDKIYLLPLSQEGGYKYYFKAYNQNGNFFGEREGIFNIAVGQLKEYKNKFAGFHIIITSEKIRQRKSASRKLFGNEKFAGEIRYGKRKDIMMLSNSGSIANIKFSGLPALLFEFLTQKNK